MPQVGERYSGVDHQGFTMIDDTLAAISVSILNWNDKAMLARLARLGRRTGEIFPSVDYLAQALGMDERAVWRSLHRLEAGRFIERVRQKNAPSRIYLIWHEAFNAPAPETVKSVSCRQRQSELPEVSVPSISTEDTSEYTNANARTQTVRGPDAKPHSTEEIPRERPRRDPPACYTETDLENFRLAVTEAAQASGRGDLGKCPRGAAIEALQEAKSYPVDFLIQSVRREFCSRLDPRRPQNMRTWGLLRIIVNQILRRQPEYDGPPQPKPPERAEQACGSINAEYAQFELWCESKGIPQSDIRTGADLFRVWDQFELERPLAQRAAA